VARKTAREVERRYGEDDLNKMAETEPATSLWSATGSLNFFSLSSTTRKIGCGKIWLMLLIGSPDEPAGTFSTKTSVW